MAKHQNATEGLWPSLAILHQLISKQFQALGGCPDLPRCPSPTRSPPVPPSSTFWPSSEVMAKERFVACAYCFPRK